MNLVQTFGELLGELVDAAEFWAALYLLDLSEESFNGHDGLFHHCGWW